MNCIKRLVLYMLVSLNMAHAESISVLSWNLLGPATRDVEHFGFLKNDYGRLGKHLQIIQQYQADVLCLQEVDLTTLHFLNNYFLGEYFQGAYQEKGAHGGVVVYLKRSIFEMQFALRAPLRSGASHSPGAIACAIVEHKQSYQKILVGSIHISKSNDRRASQSGVLQLKDLCDVWGTQLPESVLVAGDYNTMYSEIVDTTLPLISSLTTQKFEMYQHASCTSSTIHGGFSSVDHVLFSGFTVDVKESRVDDGNYVYEPITTALTAVHQLSFPLIHTVVPSDHLPVYVTLKLSRENALAAINSSAQISRFVKK